MQFGSDQLAEIGRYLDDKWPTPRTCPACRNNPDHWRVSATPVLLPLLTGRSNISTHDFGRAIESLAAAPAVALTCSACGYIMLFSAAGIGVSPVEERSDERWTIESQ